MKKNFTQVVSVLACCGVTGVTAQEQLKNSDFEQWEKRSQVTIWVSGGPAVGKEPYNWNSFLTACSSYSPTPTLFMFGQDQLQRSQDVRPGSKGINSAYLFSTEIMGIVANGNLTTGSIHMGSMSATNELNYNFTDLREGIIENKDALPYDPTEHRATFTGRPDSVVVWSKFIPLEESKPSGETTVFNEAQLSFILHDAVTYKEPHATEAEREAALVAETYITTPATKNQWVCFSKALEYHKTIQPSYLLASFTTNKIPGSGRGGDQLWVDDMRFIYNTKLRSLAIGGEAVSEFDEDVYDYVIAKPASGIPSIEDIAAIPYGKDARVSKTVGENGEVVIIVTDEKAKGEKSRTYTLRFADAPQMTLTLTLPAGVSYGAVITPVVSGQPEGAIVSYEIDKPAMLTPREEGGFVVNGSGELSIKAVYRAEGQPVVYSNTHVMRVLPLPLYVSVQDVQYKRGSMLPTYKFQYQGLLAEDSLVLTDVFRIKPSATSEVEKTSMPGSVFPITLNPGEAYNYAVIAQGEAQVTVIKPALKVTAKSFSRGEGKENPVLTYSYNGFVNGEKETTPGVMKSLPQIVCEAGENANAGEKYPIVISGASTDLYDLTHVNGVLTIKKNPGAIIVSDYAVAYGDEPFSIKAEGAYEGAAYKFYPVDKKVVGVATATGLATIKGAGTTKVNVQLSENSEYMAATSVAATVTVAKAPMTIKAVNCERLAGEENPAFALDYAGFVYGETPETVFATLPEATCEATKDSPAGDYAITVAPVTAANYEVKTENGVMTVKIADGMDAVEVSGVRVIAAQGELRISGNHDLQLVRIFDASGRLVKQAAHESVVCHAQSGAVYIVFVGEKVFKVIVNG
ncbi:MAG: MBG domain-containing protein [Bacteroidales bacterium]